MPREGTRELAAPQPSALITTARLLLERRAFLQAPAKGSIKYTIKAADPTYTTPGGSSHVMMLKLPDSGGPSLLIVRSLMAKGWGRTERVFVPRVAVLDENLTVTRTLSESEIKVTSGFASGPRLELVIPLTDPASSERFLLVYTDARAVGQQVEREFQLPPAGTSTSAAVGAAIGNALVRRERSAEGALEVEIKPTK